MKRILIVAAGLAVLACFACIVIGALFILAQPAPVAQRPSPQVATEAAPNTSPAVLAPTPAQAISGPAQTANGITVSVNRFTNQFPDQLMFDLEAQSTFKITQIALFVAIDAASSSSRQVPDFSPGTQVETTYRWNLNRNYLPPGVTGRFWWTVQDSSGAVLETTKQAFRVDDVAHGWKKISNDKLALYWYSGDNTFGQAIFDRGVQAMNFLQQDTGVTVDTQIQIFIYGNRTDFFNSLEPGASEWTGGRAFPDYGIVLIDIAPSNLDWGLGATTHELTHQVIHQKIKSPLGDLSMPHWTDEGLAVYYETYPGKLDSQFAVPLKRAIQNDLLQPLRTLSGGFPADSTAANLSYAESYSVVDFIIRHYGRDKLAQLLQGFKTGGFYDDIFMRVLNVDSDGLENLWRQDVGAKPRVITPHAATTATAFPTFSLSTDATPTPGK
jgi:hypothetical protein